MSYLVRRMRSADIPQVYAIDRECFPTQWPAVPYRSDLASNPLSHYLVVLEDLNSATEAAYDSAQSNGATRQGFPHGLKRFFPGQKSSESPTRQRVLGVVGFWIVAGEAHISTIAVRQAHRGLGLGELLLNSAIELAQLLNAEVVTLEVRASNTLAQRLYEKYGFTTAGRRKRYYPDNEDAVIMSTEAITSAPFQNRFQQRKSAHAEVQGHPKRLFA